MSQQGSQFSVFFQKTPPTTKGIIGLCSFLYLVQIMSGLDLHHFTLSPRNVVSLHEFYRLVTSALFHADFMHIGMNMLSAVVICSMVEKHIGSISLIITTLWSILLTSIIYTATAVLLSAAFGYDGLMYQHAVGFSGVLFHLSVLECNMGQNRSRDLFGIVTVPSYLYPWVLLFALQFFMPGLSFMGHLAGIVTGTLQYHGVLDGILVEESYLKEMDSWSSLRWMSSMSSFVPTCDTRENISQGRRGPQELVGAICRFAKVAGRLVMNVLETIKVIIFGRGRELNSNIQLEEWSRPVMGHSLDDEDAEDEDDWSGLPPMRSREHARPSQIV